MKMLILMALTSSAIYAANWRMIRRVAQAGVCAASMIDARSTLRPGLQETNPILGQGASVVGVKIGLCVVPIVTAEWYIRHHKIDEKPAAIASMGAVGVFSTMAVSNARIK